MATPGVKGIGNEFGYTLSGVLVTEPQDQEMLQFQAASGLWKNVPPGSGGLTVMTDEVTIEGDGTSTNKISLKRAYADDDSLEGIGTSAQPFKIRKVYTDATMSGDGTAADPLTVEGIPSTVETDDITIQGDGSIVTPISLKKVFADGDTLQGNGISGDALALLKVYTDGDTIDGEGISTTPIILKKVYTDATMTGLGTSASPLHVEASAVTPTTVYTDGDTIQGDGSIGTPVALKKVYVDDVTVQGDGTSAGVISLKKVFTDAVTIDGTGISGDSVTLKKVFTDGTTITGLGTSVSPLAAVAGVTSVTTDGDTIQGDGTALDAIALKKVYTDATMTGLGTSASPLHVEASAITPTTVYTDGDTIQGDGSIGTPVALKKVYTDSSLTGLGTLASPLHATGSAITDDITIQGDGTVGDPIALKKVFTDMDTLTGDGTSANYLSLGKVYADQVTVTGDGTSGNPLEAPIAGGILTTHGDLLSRSDSIPAARIPIGKLGSFLRSGGLSESVSLPVWANPTAPPTTYDNTKWPVTSAPSLSQVGGIYYTAVTQQSSQGLPSGSQFTILWSGSHSAATGYPTYRNPSFPVFGTMWASNGQFIAPTHGLWYFSVMCQMAGFLGVYPSGMAEVNIFCTTTGVTVAKDAQGLASDNFVRQCSGAIYLRPNDRVVVRAYQNSGSSGTQYPFVGYCIAYQISYGQS